MKNIEAIADVRTEKVQLPMQRGGDLTRKTQQEGLQAAIDSGAKGGRPQYACRLDIQPIKLTGNQELIFEPGTVVTAKRGEYEAQAIDVHRTRYRKSHHPWLRRDLSHVEAGLYQRTCTGTVWLAPLVWTLPKAEWRMTLSIRGCKTVNVSGLTLKDSGEMVFT